MRTRVIAVDGLGGAGKSSFADHLAAALGGAEIVHTDDFATWDNPIDWWPEVVRHVLVPLAKNQAVRFQRSQWASEERSWVEVQPADFTILEGVTASRDAFRPYLAYSIWIEAPHALRLRRGLKRDGDDARKQWEMWMVEEDDYVATERPHERADLIVRGDCDHWS